MHQRIKTIYISYQALKPKTRNNLNQEEYYQDLLTNLETHDLDKTYRFIK